MRAIGALLLIGCASGTGVDLVLVPDPNLNSEDALIEAVDTVVVILDNESGLYFTGDERATGNVQIENVDGDRDELEVVSTVVVPDDHLPVVRVLRGTMPDVSLDVRFLGIPSAGGPPIALGRAQGVDLMTPIERIEVPFNLRPDLLPPRITQVLPGNGMTVEDCVVMSVILMFSAPIDGATVAPAVRVNGEPPDDVIVDMTGLTATLLVSNVSGSGESLSYTIRVESTVRGVDGRALDQSPSPGEQPFEEQYSLICEGRAMMPTDACGGCGQSGLECVDGECVPSTCDDVVCTEQFVCDPAISRCAPDCRIWGDDICPDARPSCDTASGVCIDPP